MIEFIGRCIEKRRKGNTLRNDGLAIMTNHLIVNGCCGASIKPHDKDDLVCPMDASHPWDKPYLEEEYQFLGIAFFEKPPVYPLQQKGAVEVQITLDNGDILTVWEQKECICNG